MSELYLLVMVGGLALLVFITQYLIIRLSHIVLFFKIKGTGKVEMKGWLILFLLLY